MPFPSLHGSPNLRDFFTRDHRACDEAWALLEDALGDSRADCPALWKTFDEAMRRHLAMEEEVMFPAFEQATGMTGGPTMVMRMEHEQMRALLDDMGRCMQALDHQGTLDRGDTLLMLIQQHNLKEEGMLYPMAAQALDGRWSELTDRLAALA